MTSAPPSSAGRGQVRLPSPRDVTRLSWWREQWRRNPRYALTVRAAIAAALAWLLASILPGPAADYPYYAPFGAVLATTFTLAGSVRESVQSVGAIAVGGAVGWAVDLLPVSGTPAVVLVVVPSVLLAGWRRLGAMGGWVPTAGLFTLIIGHGEAMYIGAYAGLTGLGALIGIAVNAVFPPLPLAPAQSAAGLYRAILAREVMELADLLEAEELPTLAEWERQHEGSFRARARLHTEVSGVGEAARRNRRARRYSGSIDALQREARVLDRLALVVNDVTDLLLGDVGPYTRDRSDVLTPEEHVKIAAALRTIAAALENTTVAGTADPHVDEEEEPLSSGHVADAVEEARSLSSRADEDLFVDGILVSLRRAVDSLAEIERRDQGPPGGHRRPGARGGP